MSTSNDAEKARTVSLSNQMAPRRRSPQLTVRAADGDEMNLRVFSWKPGRGTGNRPCSARSHSLKSSTQHRCWTTRRSAGRSRQRAYRSRCTSGTCGLNDCENAGLTPCGLGPSVCASSSMLKCCMSSTGCIPQVTCTSVGVFRRRGGRRCRSPGCATARAPAGAHPSGSWHAAAPQKQTSLQPHEGESLRLCDDVTTCTTGSTAVAPSRRTSSQLSCGDGGRMPSSPVGPVAASPGREKVMLSTSSGEM
mmetsp:Transcript_12547/g.35547  ORF Transcript_12547/g.35547 Transcript_12547/m.35547 type:complete len:250 (+) Transcript_12547:442-1191(+)